MSSSSSSKWRGTARRIVSAPLENLWAVASDYCSLHEWIPAIKSCRWIGGDHPCSPGSIRYVEGSSSSWAKEELLEINERDYSLTYTVLESNMGLEDYVATLRVCGGPDGFCTVEWSFEMRPMEGTSRDKVIARFTSVLSTYIGYLEAAASTRS